MNQQLPDGVKFFIALFGFAFYVAYVDGYSGMLLGTITVTYYLIKIVKKFSKNF